MRLPVLKGKDSYKRRMVVFGGINNLQSFSDGEIEDCSGISHEKFPALTQRRSSLLEFQCETPTAATFASKECIAANGILYYDRKEIGKLSEGDKVLVQLGSKIIVFPDKMYYDTKNEKFLSLEGICTLKDIKVVFEPNKISVPEPVYKTSSSAESLSLEENKNIFRYSNVSAENGMFIFSEAELISADKLSVGDFFSEKSGTTHYRVAESIIAENGKIIVFGQHFSIEKLAAEDFSRFSAGDIVEITGCSYEANNKQAKITEVGENYLLFEENTFETKNETEFVEIKRNIPDFTCVCNYKNRLWGCVGNTIYASALGDPTNYHRYSNLSTDSFTVESNTSGDFTAAVVYGNYCLFFKQDKCYRLYGDKPSNFQLVEAFSGGISADNVKSIAEIDGKILYKGNGGVYSFYGGNPQKISDKLGDIKLSNCVGGSFGECYYLSADTENGKEEFVYNIKHGIWSKSGVRNVRGYFSHDDKLYRLMENGLFAVSDATDCECEWYVQFRPFDEDYYKTKNYSRIYITAQLFENSVIKTEISRDGSEWQTVSQVYGSKKEYINIPCPVKSCHEVKVRISGKGKSIVESLTREFSVNQG